MPIQFTCPHCNLLLQADVAHVGQPAECVQCHRGVIVPDVEPTAIAHSDLASGPTPTHDAYPENLNAANADAAMPPALSQNDALASSSFSPVDSAESSDLWSSQEQRLADPETTTVALSRMAIYSIGLLIVGVALISFLLGWSFGYELTTHQIASERSAQLRISGRINYVTNRGKMAADSQAIVAVFPVGVRPDEKLDPTHFRPEFVATQTNAVSWVALQSLGGGIAKTDRNGVYDIPSLEPAEYFVLIVSNHRSRRNGRQPTTREVVEIGRYVSRATELLQENDYLWSKQRITQSLEVDHLFADE